MSLPALLVVEALAPVAIVVAVLIIIVISCIKIVPQSQAYVIQRLGAYKCTW